jgi:hypothetical protein
MTLDTKKGINPFLTKPVNPHQTTERFSCQNTFRKKCNEEINIQRSLMWSATNATALPALRSPFRLWFHWYNKTRRNEDDDISWKSGGHYGRGQSRRYKNNSSSIRRRFTQHHLQQD